MTLRTEKLPSNHPLLGDLARRRMSLPKPDRRTPAERIRANDEMLRQLEARLPSDFHARLVDLLAGRDVDWRDEVQRVLGMERMLDVCEACVVMDREP